MTRFGGPHGAAASALSDELYAELGIPFLWLIDPDALTLETYQLNEGKWVEMGAYSQADRPRAVPFDAIELELASLWADVEPPPEGA